MFSYLPWFFWFFFAYHYNRLRRQFSALSRIITDSPLFTKIMWNQIETLTAAPFSVLTRYIWYILTLHSVSTSPPVSWWCHGWLVSYTPLPSIRQTIPKPLVVCAYHRDRNLGMIASRKNLSVFTVSYLYSSMLAGQRQRVDIPAHVRTARKGLLQKGLEEDLCRIVRHVPPTTHLVKGLNWTEPNVRIYGLIDWLIWTGM